MILKLRITNYDADIDKIFIGYKFIGYKVDYYKVISLCIIMNG